jgi:hypothetical protein
MAQKGAEHANDRVAPTGGVTLASSMRIGLQERYCWARLISIP